MKLLQDSYEFYCSQFKIQSLDKKNVYISFIVSIISLVFFCTVYAHLVLSNAHWDVGWINQVIWKNPMQLMPTDCCSRDGENSAFISWGWHFTPLFTGISLLSYLWPFGQTAWLILFFSLAPSLSVFIVVLLFLSNTKDMKFSLKFKVYFAIVLSISFGVVRAVAFPHYEIYLVPLILGLILALALNKKFLVVILLFLIISLKEDSIFYVIALIWAIGISRMSTRKIILLSIYLAIIPLAYLLSINFGVFSDPLLINFPNQTNLEAHYLGSPIFSHLSYDFLHERVFLIIRSNFLLIAFTFFLFGLSIILCNSFLMRMILCTIPFWFLSLISLSWVKGTMMTYELLPIWIPILIALIYFPYTEIVNTIKVKILYFIFLTFLTASLVGGNGRSFIRNLTYEIPTFNTLKDLDYNLKLAKSKGFKIDPFLFSISPKNASYRSSLHDVTHMQDLKCFVHFPGSTTPEIFKAKFNDWQYITTDFEFSGLKLTCTK
jgi:hypothetical protein